MLLLKEVMFLIYYSIQSLSENYCLDSFNSEWILASVTYLHTWLWHSLEYTKQVCVHTCVTHVCYGSVDMLQRIHLLEEKELKTIILQGKKKSCQPKLHLFFYCSQGKNWRIHFNSDEVKFVDKEWNLALSSLRH